MESERRIRRKKRKRRNLIITIIIFTIAFAGYFAVNNQFTRGLYFGGTRAISDNNKVLETADDSTAIYLSFDKGLLMCSKQGIGLINASGDFLNHKFYKLLSSKISRFSNLSLKSSDKYIAVYDNNGKNYIIFNNNRIIAEGETEFKIVLVRPFDNGEFIVVTEENSAKNKVTLFDKNGKEKFIWHSGVNYVVDAVISNEENKLIISSLELSSGLVNSKLIFFEVGSTTPFCEKTIENTIITNLSFYSLDKIVALSDMGLYYLSDSGDLISNYSFNSRMLENYKYLDNGKMALSFANNGGNTSTVEIISKDGKKIGSTETLANVKHMDCRNGNILLCENRSLEIITKKGMKIRTVNYNKDLNKSFFIGKNKMVLVGNSEVRIIN